LCGPFNSHSFKAGCFLQFTATRSVSQTAPFGSLRDGNDRKNFGFYKFSSECGDRPPLRAQP